MTIWEEYGITLEDYVKAFTKALEEAWGRELENKAYPVNLIDDKPRVSAIINIKDEC